jgi:predicted transcriptional regulator
LFNTGIGGKKVADAKIIGRTQLEMHVEILEALDICGPLKLTSVMHIVDANYSMMRAYLDFLTKQGLIESKIMKRERKVYAITQLGVTVVNELREIKEPRLILEEQKDLYML